MCMKKTSAENSNLFKIKRNAQIFFWIVWIKKMDCILFVLYSVHFVQSMYDNNFLHFVHISNCDRKLSRTLKKYRTIRTSHIIYNINKYKMHIFIAIWSIRLTVLGEVDNIFVWANFWNIKEKTRCIIIINSITFIVDNIII